MCLHPRDAAAFAPSKQKYGKHNLRACRLKREALFLAENAQFEQRLLVINFQVGGRGVEVAESPRAEAAGFDCRPSAGPDAQSSAGSSAQGGLAGQTSGILVTTPPASAPCKSLKKWSCLAIQTRQASRIWDTGLKLLLLSAEHLGEPNPIGHMVLGSLQSNSPIPWAY